MTRTERTYYAVTALYSGAGWFLGPVYPLFLLSCGLDLLQMNLVLATFFIAVFVLEVPTGAVADVYGRKISFLLSCIVRAIAFGVYAFADSFVDCLIGEIIDAIGLTLATGALDAWAVDGMRKEGDEGPYDRLFARANMIVRALMVIGGVAGGYLASISFTYAWIAGASGFLLAGLLGAVTMYSDRGERAQQRDPSSSVFRTIGEGWTIVRAAPVLMLLCLVTLGLFFAAAPAHMLWQKRFSDLGGVDVWVMGWIWALINLATLIGSWLLPRFLDRLGREYVLLATTLFRAATLGLAAAATGFSPAVFFYLLCEVGMGITEPTLQAWMNERVPSAQRATVLSVRSMFGTLGGSLGLVCLGFVSRDAGIPASWATSALVFLLVAPAFLVLGRLAARAVPVAVEAA